MNLFNRVFCLRSESRSQVFTANGQFTDLVCGDTVYIVDPTLYHVVRVVLSTNSVMIHPAFNNRRRIFFVGFSALWAPLKLVNELAVNTDPIEDCNLCPPCPLRFCSITDSAEHRQFAALLRKTDEHERLEEQLKEHFNQLDR